MVAIAQISDLHLRPRGTPAYRVAETNMLAERAVESLLALSPRPDAVVVTGDIADGGVAAEFRLAADILGRLPMPVYPVVGNHDDAGLIRDAFPGLPVPPHCELGRLYYAVDIGPVRLIVLDSAVKDAAHGALSPAQIEFLDDELSAAADRPAMVAVHHPPFRSGMRRMDADNLRDAGPLAEVIGRHRNAMRILCGHLHRTIVSSFAGTPLIVAPSVAHQLLLTLDADPRFGLVFEPPAYFLHRWTAEDGMASHLVYVERFPGPYPFYADETTPLPHPI